MGANQSAGRNIPLRPRTPLQFGSANSALPPNPTSYAITSPAPSTDSVSTLLSQESYFHNFALDTPSPASSTEYSEYTRTRSLSSLSSTSDVSEPHRFTCPTQSCPYTIIGYATASELSHHLATAHGFAAELDMECYDWFSSPAADTMEQYQQASYPPQQQAQKKQPQQCDCHHCFHYGGNPAQYELPMQPNMQIQMPPPPTIIGYHDAGFELVSWRREGQYKPRSNKRMKQAEYSSLVQSGMYMDFSQVGASGRSSFM